MKSLGLLNAINLQYTQETVLCKRREIFFRREIISGLVLTSSVIQFFEKTEGHVVLIFLWVAPVKSVVSSIINMDHKGETIGRKLDSTTSSMNVASLNNMVCFVCKLYYRPHKFGDHTHD